MWEFARLYGKYFSMVGDNPCGTNVLVQVKEDEESNKPLIELKE